MNFSTKHIGYLERDYLDELQGKVNENWDSFYTPNNDTISLIKVLGVSSFWRNAKDDDISLHSLMQDVHAGFYGAKVPLIYLIIGESSKINLYVGTYQPNQGNSGQSSDRSISTLAISLQSAYPGIELLMHPQQSDLLIQKTVTQSFKYAGLVIGTPTVKTSDKSVGSEQIERLIRGL